MPTILVIDDEPGIQELIKYTLERENYKVITAPDGITGLTMAQVYLPDLIILDIMLPGKDGYEVCRALKANARTAPVPIIMLSAKDAEIDKVLGLELGAYDYVTKPFSPRELAARVKANLRRREYTKEPGDEKEIRYKDLVIRPERYEAVLNGSKLDLTPKEFEMLVLFASNPGMVFTRNMLLEKIWGFNELRETRTVDVHIRYLRQKIERDPANPEYIETLRGVGYRFNSPAN
ncbi:MAG: response regulator transcription factor [Peptococcaceae bacterium]|nr:response regulator transcription factor [Peptococcaceae bacterium]